MHQSEDELNQLHFTGLDLSDQPDMTVVSVVDDFGKACGKVVQHCLELQLCSDCGAGLILACGVTSSPRKLPPTNRLPCGSVYGDVCIRWQPSDAGRKRVQTLEQCNYLETSCPNLATVSIPTSSL